MENQNVTFELVCTTVYSWGQNTNIGNSHICKVFVTKSCVGLFLRNRIWDLGWFGPVGQLKVQEFFSKYFEFRLMKRVKYDVVNKQFFSWTFNFLKLLRCTGANVHVVHCKIKIAHRRTYIQLLWSGQHQGTKPWRLCKRT